MSGSAEYWIHSASLRAGTMARSFANITQHTRDIFCLKRLKKNNNIGQLKHNGMGVTTEWISFAKENKQTLVHLNPERQPIRS